MNHFFIILHLLLVMLFLGCGKGFIAKENSSIGQPVISESVNIFSKTLQPILRTNCSGCHGIFQDPKFAVSDSKSAHDTILSSSLVNEYNPGMSTIVQKIAGGHNGFNVLIADDLAEQIQSWITQVGILPIIDTGEPPEEIEFETNTYISAASKVKFLIHGGPLTSVELSQINSAANKSAFDSLLSSFSNVWIESEEFNKKLEKFLSLTLQQDGAALTSRIPDYYPILGNILDGYANNCGPMGNNLREMFVKTSLKIIEDGRPFNEVVNTRKWMVTTATLVMLAWMDNDRIGKANGAYKSFADTKKLIDNVCTPLLLTASDYTDWREVTLTTATENTSQRIYSDVSGWRNVAAGDTVDFAVPRVGFFTTPMFLRKWITNDDNEFRVTTNQALIGSLNQTFTLSDPTLEMRSLSPDDTNHSLPGTACLQCHKLMDPMRDLWKSMLNARDYRFHPRTPPGTPVFAFQGVRTNIPTIESFANVLATHPNFAKGWTQKVCQYLNSQECDESDPEFIRVSNVFVSSNLNFKTLYKTMALSPIITGTELTQNHETKNFFVSIARKSHLCHSINLRVRALQNAYGATQSALDGGEEICNKTTFKSSSGITISPIASAIPDDLLPRGSTVLSQGLSNSPFFIQATHKLCEYSSYYFAVKSSIMPSTASAGTLANARTDIDNFINYYMGVSVDHPRRTQISAAVNNVFDYAYANSTSVSDRDKRVSGLREAFSFGCSIPEMLAVGL